MRGERSYLENIVDDVAMDEEVSHARGDMDCGSVRVFQLEADNVEFVSLMQQINGIGRSYDQESLTLPIQPCLSSSGGG